MHMQRFWAFKDLERRLAEFGFADVGSARSTRRSQTPGDGDPRFASIVARRRTTRGRIALQEFGNVPLVTDTTRRVWTRHDLEQLLAGPGGSACASCGMRQLQRHRHRPRRAGGRRGDHDLRHVTRAARARQSRRRGHGRGNASPRRRLPGADRRSLSSAIRSYRDIAAQARTLDGLPGVERRTAHGRHRRRQTTRCTARWSPPTTLICWVSACSADEHCSPRTTRCRTHLVAVISERSKNAFCPHRFPPSSPSTAPPPSSGQCARFLGAMLTPGEDKLHQIGAHYQAIAAESAGRTAAAGGDDRVASRQARYSLQSARSGGDLGAVQERSILPIGSDPNRRGCLFRIRTPAHGRHGFAFPPSSASSRC